MVIEKLSLNLFYCPACLVKDDELTSHVHLSMLDVTHYDKW